MATVKSSENMPVLLLSVAFAPGEVAKIIEVPLLDDHLDSDAPNEDEEETFNLEITDNTGAPVTTAVGTILDDDPIVANFIYPYAVVLDEPARIDEGETFTIQGRVTDTADSTNVTVVLDMDLNFDGDTNDSGESVQVHSGLTGTARGKRGQNGFPATTDPFFFWSRHPACIPLVPAFPLAIRPRST